MSRFAVGTTDRFAGNLDGHSLEATGLPATNAQDPRPRVVFQAAEGADGLFDTFVNHWIDIDEGAGEVSVSTTVIGGIGRTSLAADITAALNASALTLTYSCFWDVNDHCVIQTTSGTFSILWKTGTHGSDNADTSLATELGFDTLNDDAGFGGYVAGLKRFSTLMMMIFDLGKAVALDAFALILDGDSETNYGTSPGFLRAFGYNVGTLSLSGERWNAIATLSLDYSPRPVNTENTVQIAHQAVPVAYRYYAVVWRHFDESAVHRIGLCRAYYMLQSTTRTIDEMSGHGMIDDSTPLGIRDYYPAAHELRWRVPLAFAEWEETDYRAVVHAMIRHGRTDVVLYAIRWASITAGTVDAEDEADLGLVGIAAIVDSSLDDFGGSASAYLSGAITLEQVR